MATCIALKEVGIKRSNGQLRKLEGESETDTKRAVDRARCHCFMEVP